MVEDRRTVNTRDSVHFISGTKLSSELGPAVATSRTAPGASRKRARAAITLDPELPPDFQAALREVGLVEQETIYVDSAPGQRARLDSGERDRVVLTPAQPRQGAQVVLYLDESGGMSWHLPDARAERGARRARRPQRFTIDTRTGPALRSLEQQRTLTERGIVTKLGRKIFKILVIPVASELLKRPLVSLVGRIEKRHRQQLVRPVTIDNYRSRVKTPFTDWDRLSTGATLLIVHGIFSTTEGMLSLLPPHVMRELLDRYEGRVIALDQITVSQDPEENARFFLETMRKGARAHPIELDILCHSRGGIVSRLVAERGRDLVPDAPCTVRKVLFVATPNRGSPLANPDHIVDMIDVFTNLVTSFPDGPVTYSLEVLLSIIKLVAATGGRHLPGLAAMGTEGFIADLNRAGGPVEARYAAVSSEYEPSPQHDNGFFTGRFADAIMDRVFSVKGTALANDLVVPRDGVFDSNGHPAFPISQRLVFDAADRVWHSGFFAEPRTHRHMLEFLAPDVHAAATPPPLGGFSRASPPRSGRRNGRGGTIPKGGHLPAATPRRKRKNGRGHIIPRGRLRAKAARKGRKAGRRPLARARAVAPRPKAEPPRPAAEVHVTRDPAIDFHEQVMTGKTYPLTVRLEDVIAGGGGEDKFEVPIPTGRDDVDLRVSLVAPGFDVKPALDLPLRVGRSFDAKKERVTFRLTPRPLGSKPVRREIRADIWYKGSPLGSVMHETYVIPAGWSGPAPAGSRISCEPFLLEARRKDCDLTVRIEGMDDEGAPPYRIRLDCSVRGHEYEGRFGGELTVARGRGLVRYIQELFQDSFSTYPKQGNGASLKQWQRTFSARLDAVGRKLWTWLPREFRDEYFRLHDDGARIGSIRIHSHEMVVPWELVVPHRDSGSPRDFPPLGIRHVLGRWRPGLRIRPSPQRMAVQAACVINPTYSGTDILLWSALEADELRKLIPWFEVPRPADMPTLSREVLDRKDIQLLHFTGHGDYSKRNADLNYLKIEGNGRLAAIDLGAAQLLRVGRPIVYLNACSVGSPGLVVGRMGGFAAACLEAGCSGIIAPYWPVNDETAANFSVQLYGKLLAGQAVGLALQELRAENRKDPTFLAYSYFGDPWATAVFSARPAAKPRKSPTKKPRRKKAPS